MTSAFDAEARHTRIRAITACKSCSTSLTHFRTDFPSLTPVFTLNHTRFACTLTTHTESHTRRAFDQHGGSFAPVEIHVPVPSQDVTRHSALPLHHDGRCPPGSLSWRRKHVEPPGSRSSLPDHGQGACCAELPQWQQRSCWCFRWCACLPHPREPSQATHDSVQGSPGCRHREPQRQAGYANSYEAETAASLARSEKQSIS